MKKTILQQLFLWPFILVTSLVYAADGKLLATAGLTQVEGSGGGGIVPWATLSGYDSQEQVSVSAFNTHVSVDDYQLNVIGLATSFYDRVEFSIARQTFDLPNSVIGLGLGDEINQTIYGLKTRLYGDVIYSQFPQLSFGIQYKKLSDGAIAGAIGAAENQQGVDYYLAATKVHLGAVNGYNLVWNLTARATKANQMGLLGFGSQPKQDHQLVFEASLGVLLSRNLAIGVEYRQKPDNLAAFKEDNWKDIFITYIPNKHFNITLAYADLGNIAVADKQQGIYVSTTGYLW
ncbi:DUF3034 family protein [Catenovulum sp. 2E275]|uniref:DUF3034 family protein n=1 Tax=Catenovulum sp. 2E275 TaxID=2980497 RepID=UPI0021D011DF|nr:DUF3034 family protein [Catenovulum sp. 2E275]MCU4677227.1 DUF3034 family protein [Catenovulum sp. 2E275]